MFRGLGLIALAGCGRVGFGTAGNAGGAGSDGESDDAPSDVVQLGHDEDGDGVPDTSDTCTIAYSAWPAR